MTRRLTTTLLLIFAATASLLAQGWPANYEGVMLQGFWWDSYQDTRWNNLKAQADELSQYFQLIWIPNSGKTSDYYHSQRSTMGYDPCFWLDHTSCFGTEDELRQMIATFKAKGTGIIEDVVINHKNGLNTWVDFPDESKNGYSITWDNVNYTAICSNDECNTAANLPQWSKNGKKTGGAADTGDNFDGYRDLDHTNAQVQQNVKTYLSFLLNDLGYAGFRYDMVKGFAARYVGTYNTSANPTYSVGEYWDGNATSVKNWIDGTKVNGVIQSAAFDFPLKYQINKAFQSGVWSALVVGTLTTTSGYDRYSVTFVDNHDTGKNPANTSDGPLGKNVAAANAFVLVMPGTPCVWLKHWVDYKGTLKRLIALRHAVGLTNQSAITQRVYTGNGAVLCVQGAKGSALLLLGEATAKTDGYQLALEGVGYKYYVSQGVDLSALSAITDTDAASEEPVKVEIPSFCTVSDGETCAFFEAPANWGNVKCWRWDNQYNYTGNNWPGVDCTYVGTASSGRKVWKWSWNGNRIAQSSPNQGIIFNDGSNQTADLDFENGGYYTNDGLQGKVTASVDGIAPVSADSARLRVYTVGGRLVAVYPAGTALAEALGLLRQGVYVVGGRKYTVK